MVITKICINIENEEPIFMSLRDGGYLHWSNLPEHYKILSIDVMSDREDRI